MKEVCVNISNENLTFYIYNPFSTAEFTIMFEYDEYKKYIPENKNTAKIIWFSRIKTKKEGIGYGKLLMQKVCNYMDENNIIIICGINPYGKRGLSELKRFYTNSGFVHLDNDMCIRIPG